MHLFNDICNLNLKDMNAKKEFVEHTQDKKVKCSFLVREGRYNYETNEYENKLVVLKVNYSESDYDAFLQQLDYEYDNGYGGQELEGTIWYEDGTWSSRGECEYDGSEWWEYNQCPEIYENCL